MSGRERKIREQKGREFRERRQNNRIVDQLNRLRSAGYSTDDINAAAQAGKGNAWEYLQGWKLVKDPATGQWTQRDGYATTTPGAVTAGPNPYANATVAPAWAQATGPATTPTATPWWANKNATTRQSLPPATTTRPGASKVLPMPTASDSSPFSGVTGTAGKIPTVPAWGSSMANETAALTNTQPRPAPSAANWGPSMAGATSALLTNQNGGVGTTPYGPTLPPAQGGTKGGHYYNPMTGIPDFPMLNPLVTTPTTSSIYGGYGYGSSWGRGRRGGGGYGSWPRYKPQGYAVKGGGRQSGGTFSPLTNWSIG